MQEILTLLNIISNYCSIVSTMSEKKYAAAPAITKIVAWLIVTLLAAALGRCLIVWYGPVLSDGADQGSRRALMVFIVIVAAIVLGVLLHARRPSSVLLAGKDEGHADKDEADSGRDSGSAGIRCGIPHGR